MAGVIVGPLTSVGSVGRSPSRGFGSAFAVGNVAVNDDVKGVLLNRTISSDRMRPFFATLPGPEAARRELAGLGGYRGTRPSAPTVAAKVVPAPDQGQALLAGWRMLLDAGRMQDGEPFLAGTAKPVAARVSAATAAEIGVPATGMIAVRTERGSITVPVEIKDMPDRVVWLPLNSAGCAVHRELGAGPGALVTLEPASGAAAGAATNDSGGAA